MILIVWMKILNDVFLIYIYVYGDDEQFCTNNVRYEIDNSICQRIYNQQRSDIEKF